MDRVDRISMKVDLNEGFKNGAELEKFEVKISRIDNPFKALNYGFFDWQ